MLFVVKKTHMNSTPADIDGIRIRSHLSLVAANVCPDVVLYTRCCPHFRKNRWHHLTLVLSNPWRSVQTSVPLWTSRLCHPSVGRVQNVYIWLIYMARNCAHTYICTHKINSNKFSTTENEVYYVTFWVILFFVPYVMFWCLVCLNLN